MNIGKRLGLGFGILVGLLVLVGGVAYFSLEKVAAQTDIIHRHATEMEMIADLQRGFSEIVMPANDYIITADPKYKGAFEKISKELDKQIDNVKNIELGSAEQDMLKRIKEDYAKIKELAGKIFAMQIQAGNPEAAKLMEEMDYQYGDPAKEKAEQLHDATRQDIAEARMAGDRVRATATIMVIVFSLISILAGIGLGIRITQGITRPVRDLVHSANLVSDTGNLEQEIKIESQDEVGELAKSFRTVMGWMKDMSVIAKKIAEGDLTQAVKPKSDKDTFGNAFQSMTEGLKRIMTSISEAIGQITSASSEILAASQEQAAAAREQSSAVTETTTAAKELSTTSEAVGESIKKVAQVAAHAMAGMGKIKESIDKTNGMLNSLGEKSQKIGKITELIDDVADQTNLLAVNASIEAARAGEQGRGFTVVADEIRKLADSTAKSTKDITSLIELIQHEMSNAIMSMETSIQSVDEEARLAQQTTEKSKEIAMSTHQQISGAKQIAEAMMNIDETMKQVAAGAQQSQASVKMLTTLAGELKGLAAKFKL
jgi:methyl-accepting chemotaxis protein